MPKRKRSEEDSAGVKFAEHKAKLYQALWDAKGHLRQWQSKRIRESQKKGKGQAEKAARLEKEVLVLKVRGLSSNSYAVG